MEKKYELTDETITVCGRKLYRIRSMRAFNGVAEGETGGYVEKENNLSHFGDAWVSGNAEVFDNAWVCGDARVSGDAQVFGDAWVFDNAWVFSDAKVYGNAQVFDNAEVYGDARVFGDARLYDNARVSGDARVYGDAQVSGDAQVFGDARVSKISDYIVFKNFWSSGRYFTWTRSNNMWKVGCFYGTGEQLVAKAYKDSELSGREYARVVAYVESALNDKDIEKKQKPRPGLLHRLIMLLQGKSI